MYCLCLCVLNLAGVFLLARYGHVTDRQIFCFVSFLCIFSWELRDKQSPYLEYQSAYVQFSPEESLDMDQRKKRQEGLCRTK